MAPYDDGARATSAIGSPANICRWISGESFRRFSAPGLFSYPGVRAALGSSFGHAVDSVGPHFSDWVTSAAFSVAAAVSSLCLFCWRWFWPRRLGRRSGFVLVAARFSGFVCFCRFGSFVVVWLVLVNVLGFGGRKKRR